ncbi:MAG: dienelactone hydrolase family protein [Acidobacteria bacterium]|nr:dienelactone hydrolase family protein [Acidobacteriota bacterium]
MNEVARRMSRRAVMGLAGAIPALCNKTDSLEDFGRFPSSAGSEGKQIYRIGQGPPVLFLHELPGLIPEAVDFARRLSGCGFTVYLPLLFGRAGRSSLIGTLLRTPCRGEEFECFSDTSLGTIVQWTARLTKAISDHHQRGIAVIGNCLTGAVPLALMANQEAQTLLRACVVAQPALPMGPFGAPHGRARMALGLTEDMLSRAAQSGVPVLALRITSDSLVPEECMLGLAARFRGRPFEYVRIEPDPHCPHRSHGGHTHASLTLAYCDNPASHGRQAFDKVTAFLKKHLGD